MEEWNPKWYKALAALFIFCGLVVALIFIIIILSAALGE